MQKNSFHETVSPPGDRRLRRAIVTKTTQLQFLVDESVRVAEPHPPLQHGPCHTFAVCPAHTAHCLAPPTAALRAATGDALAAARLHANHETMCWRPRPFSKIQTRVNGASVLLHQIQ